MFENDLMRVQQFEGPLTSGPLARWQRKANESSQEAALLSCSLNNASTSINRGGSNSKTPMKSGNASKSKTPNHTPGGSKAKTPGKYIMPLNFGRKHQILMQLR